MTEINDVLIMMGNGPSLRDQDFELIKKYDSLGLNAAYRYYRKTGFWPKYFACFDRLVCDHHQPEYEKLIGDSPIEQFYFVSPEFFDPKIRAHPKFKPLKFKRIIPMDSITEMSTSFDPFIDLGCTGANAVQVAILLGYKKIILLGCDSNYIEMVDGAERYDQKYPHKLRMAKTPETNPNYWFDDYQQKGDRFNVPNPNVFHLPAWERLAKLAPKDVEIVNCSQISKITCFPKSTLEDEYKKDVQYSK